MSSVDIVVPCYNYARYLRQCVASALDQPGVDVRVLIIDDHSSDDTPEVGSQLSAADPRVRFRRHAVNKGHIATYNEGLSEATADYVVLLSADDLLTPGSLGRAVDLMDRNSSVGLVYGCPVSFQGDTLPKARTRLTNRTIWKGRDWIELMCKAGRNFLSCPEAVMRTRVQHQIGLYRPELPHSGDMEVWLRAAAVSDVGRVNGVDQAYYRVHNLNMHTTTYAGFLRDLEGRRDAFKSFLGDESLHVPEADRLLKTALGAVAIHALACARRTIEAEPVDEESVEQLLQFAVSLDPAVVDSIEWRAIVQSERRRQTLLSALSRHGAQHLERLQHHLAWRRWRRTGIFSPLRANANWLAR